MNPITETRPPSAAVKGGVIAYLQVDGATEAAEFYSRAFGAETVSSQPTDEPGSDDARAPPYQRQLGHAG